jgi:hydroxymethylbilane synthase
MHSFNNIPVAARASKLSRVQVKEVLNELQEHREDVSFKVTYFETTGDLDQRTSLRDLDKTDFFTKEIDAFQLQGKCRLSIHSAKDLPDPLPVGLKVIALTKGVDSSDSLVMREGVTLGLLPERARIATSSQRREEMVLRMRSGMQFVDIRGTIEQRLAKLENGTVDGVVIAEAALIRLGLTHLNRVVLEGETTENQGRLAVIARGDDDEMKQLLACIDASEKSSLFRA